MSWKKNGVSYLIWFIYAAAVSGLLAGTAGAVCVREDIAVYWGILMTVVILLASGNLVFLIHRFAERISAFAAKNRKALYALEAVLAAAFFVTGIFLRAGEMEEAFRPSAYYEAAKVAEGHRIPQIVHGAVYLYVHLLHAVYLLLGNFFSAGLWLQIVLQLGAVLVFYFTVRKLFGSVAALTVLAFCTAGSYMIGNALVLSPDILFFLLFALAAALITLRCRQKLVPVLFLPAGALAAFCTYMDAAGALLLLLTIGVIFCCRRKGADPKSRATAVLFCFLGTVSGFFAACSMDAFLSGKSLFGVLEAWGLLYCPEGFRLPVSMDLTGYEREGLILLAVMTAGIFSFWCDRKEERLSMPVIGAGCLAAAAAFGIFTPEMPGYLFLYLFAVLCAGTGLGQCFVRPAGEEAEAMNLNRQAPEEAVCPNRQASGEILNLDGQVSEETTSPVRPASKEAVNPDGPASEEAPTGGTATEGKEQPEEGSMLVKYIPNPLPLPKKHEKRVLDYPQRNYPDEDDYDYPVSDEDDFDL